MLRNSGRGAPVSVGSLTVRWGRGGRGEGPARVTPARTAQARLPAVPECHGVETSACRAPHHLAVSACHRLSPSPASSQNWVMQKPLVRQPKLSPQGRAACADVHFLI